MGFIYKITNIVNNKCYIGQTIRPPFIRWYQHKYYSKKGVRYKSALYNAIQKYGLDCFLFEVIEEVDNDLLNERERFFIALFNSFEQGYNNTTGGDGNKGCKRKRKHEDIIPELYKELQSTEKVANYLGISRITVRSILKEKNLFKRYKKRSLDYKKLEVVQLSLDLNIINVFSSLTEACKSIGLTNKNVSELSKCCKGKRKTAYGFIWKYKHDMET